jgi:hypothetical protein
MPLVRIDVIEGRSDEEIQALADALESRAVVSPSDLIVSHDGLLRSEVMKPPTARSASVTVPLS